MAACSLPTSAVLPATRASASSSRSSRISIRNAGSSRSLSPIVTPARASRYSARGTGRLISWYASLSARDCDSATTRSAALAPAARSGWSCLLRSKNARSSAARSTSKVGARPSSANGSWPPLELDGLATATRALGVGVVELEPVAHHPAHEVALHAAEVDQALRIDHDRDPVLGEHRVGRTDLLGPLEHVGETRAAAAAHADADHRVGGAALGALLRDLRARGLGDLDLALGDRAPRRRGGGIDSGCSHCYLRFFL